MDLWPITLRARRSLLSTFEDLDEDQWEVPSLCDGWTMRQVLAHLVLAARPPMARYAAATVKARGNFDRANHTLAVADAGRPTDQLLSDYRRVLDHRFSPPGWPDAAPFSDILLHTLDVRIPLGLDTEQPAGDYAPALDLLFGRFKRSFTRSGRPQLAWAATDHPWTHGTGPEVSGTMQDLTLTAAGRPARLDHLAGPGVEPIRAWLGGSTAGG